MKQKDKVPSKVVKTPTVLSPPKAAYKEFPSSIPGVSRTFVASVIEGLTGTEQEFRPPITQADLHKQLTSCWKDKLNRMSTSSESDMAEEKVYQEATMNWDKAMLALRKTVDSGDPGAMKPARESFKKVIGAYEVAADKYIDKCKRLCRQEGEKQAADGIHKLEEEKARVIKLSQDAITHLNVVRGLLKNEPERVTFDKLLNQRDKDLRKADQELRNAARNTNPDPWDNFDKIKERWARAHALLLQITGMGDSMARETDEQVMLQYLADLETRKQEVEDAWDELVNMAVAEGRESDDLESIHVTAVEAGKYAYEKVARQVQYTTDVLHQIKAIHDLKRSPPRGSSNVGPRNSGIAGLSRGRPNWTQSGGQTGPKLDPTTDWKEVVKLKNKHLFFKDGSTYKHDKGLEPDFKFNGEDNLARYPDWKETINEMVVNNQTMSFSKKMLFLKRFTEGRANHAIQWMRNTYEGFVKAITTLETEFGHAAQDEVAVLNTKIAQAEELNLEDPKTIQNVKDYIREMRSKVEGTDPRSLQVLESAVFGLLRFEENTAAHWENYLAAREIQVPTLEHFRNWADDLQRRRVRRAQTSQVYRDSKKKNRNAKGQFVGATMEGLDSDSDEDDYYKEVFGDEVVCATERQPTGRCYYCNQAGHGLMKCQKFNMMKPKERIEIVKEKGLCFACFGQGHRPSNCPRKRPCSKCGKENHHYLLHVGNSNAVGEGLRQGGAVEESVNELKELCKNMCQLLTKMVDEKKPPQGMEGPGKKEDSKTTKLREDHGCVTDEAICALEKLKPRAWKNGYWIVPAWAEDPRSGRRVMVNVGLDPFAGCTVVSDWLLDKLGCETRTIKMQYDTVAGAGAPQEVREAGINFRSVMDDFETKEGQVTTGRIPGSIQPPPIPALQELFPNMNKITFQPFADRIGIDVLMGSNFQRAHQSLWDLDTEEWEPLIRMTHFGPACMFHRSVVQKRASQEREEVMLVQQVEAGEEEVSMEGHRLDELLERTFSLEAVGILTKQLEKQWNVAEGRAWEAVKSSITRLESGHWQCGVPWKHGRPELPQNYAVVKKLQAKLEAKMDREGKTDGARKSFQEWHENRFIRKLGQQDDLEQGFYIPWFVVLKDSESTAVRPVLHCAMPFGPEKKSLNDEILPGPKLHTDLVRVLLNMRRHEYALMCDISKMYMQFALPEEDQVFHRLIYKGEAYQFEVLPFGNRAAPFMALYALQHHVRVEGDEWMRELLASSSYVDDLMMSFPSLEQACQAWKRINSCLEKGGLKACKYNSNSWEVLESIPEELRSKKTLAIGEPDDPTALGMKWRARDGDYFYFEAPEFKGKITKRNMVSHTHKIFDPLGVIDPVTAPGKMLVKEAHTLAKVLELGWDDDLDQVEHPALKKLNQQWRWYVEQLRDLKNVKIPRLLIPKPEEGVTLHVFNDGSARSMDSVAYLVNGKFSNIVMSKRRLTQVRKPSNPNIELDAATIGARLGTTLRGFLGITGPIHFWTDNMCALHWILKPARNYKLFVSNRVAEIYALTKGDEWQHVPTDQNPADWPTRGMSVQAFERDPKRWIQGPDFIRNKKENWPKKEIRLSEEDQVAVEASVTRDKVEIIAAVEVSQIGQVMQAMTWQCGLLKQGRTEQPGTTDRAQDQRTGAWEALRCGQQWLGLHDWSRVGTWRKLWRVATVVLNLVRDRKWNGWARATEQEKWRGLRTLIMAWQVMGWQRELEHMSKYGTWPIGSELLAWGADLDQHGLIRVYGRADLSQELALVARRPVALPKKDGLGWGKLYARETHEMLGHRRGTVNAMMENIRAVAVMKHLRGVCRLIIQKCVPCQLIRKQPVQPSMQPLGEHQIPMEGAKPFWASALDFAGPLRVIEGRRTILEYLLIVVCQRTKALWVETTRSLSTDSLIMALQRMTAKVGTIAHLHSDNASTFKKGDKLIKKAYQEAGLSDELGGIDWEKVARAMDQTGVETWHFVAPHAPWSNGLAEAMVKITKEQLFQTFRHRVLDVEQFQTAVAMVVAAANSRPVGGEVVFDPDEEVQIITPNHFLMGRLGTSVIPEIPITDNLCRRYREVQDIMRSHHKAWIKRVLPTLHSTKKWQKFQGTVMEGQLVLVVEPTLKRVDWPLGVVEKITRQIRGRPYVAEVRCVSLSMDGGAGKIKKKDLVEKKVTSVIHTRPVKHLVPIDMWNEERESEEQKKVTKQNEESSQESAVTSPMKGLNDPQNGE